MADPNQSIDAQIGQHMVEVVSRDDFQEDIRLIDETDRASLVGPFGSAVRTYLPEYALEQSGVARISVLPFSRTQVRSTRKTMMEDYFVDVIVHQRIGDPYHHPKRSTPDDVRAREERWRDSVTKYGDIVTKLIEQVNIVFERPASRDVFYSAGRDDTMGRAVWLRATREATYQRAEVEEKHVIFSVMRSTWRTYRDLVVNG